MSLINVRDTPVEMCVFHILKHTKRASNVHVGTLILETLSITIAALALKITASKYQIFWFIAQKAWSNQYLNLVINPVIETTEQVRMLFTIHAMAMLGALAPAVCAKEPTGVGSYSSVMKISDAKMSL